MRSSKTGGFGLLGIGVAACLACCAVPLLSLLGGVGLVGFASVWLIGAGGLLIVLAAAAGAVVVRRRQGRSPCSTDAGPTPVELTVRR